jgi:hypothetical protein
VDLRGQRGRGVPPPDRDGLGDHRQRVDDLAVPRHRVEVQVRPALRHVGLCEWLFRQLLVDDRDHEKHQGRDHHNHPEVRVHEVDRQDEERREWHV